MHEYMLIFRHENMAGKVSPEQIQQWMQQHTAWLSEVISQKRLVGGAGLMFENAKVVHFNKTVTDGAFGNTKETLTGYIIILAESIEAAAEYAKGSPILAGEGNTIEVRQLMKA